MSTLAYLDFRSDNVGTVHEKLLQALARENNCAAAPYGADETAQRLNELYSELFEAKVVVFPVSTGTAANALSLASCARPHGAIYCAGGAHINLSEGGATEAFSGGAKIVALPGTDNKIHAQHLATALETAGRGVRNRSQPDAVPITRARENGTVYSVAEVAEIGRIARNEKNLFHMDGARFANATEPASYFSACGPKGLLLPSDGEEDSPRHAVRQHS